MALSEEEIKRISEENTKMNKQAMLALVSLTVLVYIGIFIVGSDMARTIYSVAAGITSIILIILVFFVKEI